MVEKTKIEVDWKKSERKMQKPIQFKIIKNEFEELTREIYNNQDHNDFKIIINRRTYDWKMQKNFGWK